MTPLAGIGIAMLVLAALIVLVGIAAVLPRVLRLRRVLTETWALVLAYRLVLGIGAMELRLAALERHELLRPWRRVRRWITHPLTVALIESWSRRRARVRAARLEATWQR